jgi:hypothetical protein
MTTELVIPLPTVDQPAVTQTVPLSGINYVMTFDWNSRTDRWSFSMETEDGDAILNGATLVLGIDLLRTIPRTLDYMPPGALIAGGTDDPTLNTINSVALFYLVP